MQIPKKAHTEFFLKLKKEDISAQISTEASVKRQETGTLCRVGSGGGSSLNLSLFCFYFKSSLGYQKLNLLRGFIETNCHPDSHRAAQAATAGGITQHLHQCSSRQPLPEVGSSKFISNSQQQQTSGAILQHSCLWYLTLSLNLLCIRVYCLQ